MAWFIRVKLRTAHPSQEAPILARGALPLRREGAWVPGMPMHQSDKCIMADLWQVWMSLGS